MRAPANQRRGQVRAVRLVGLAFAMAAGAAAAAGPAYAATGTALTRDVVPDLTSYRDLGSASADTPMSVAITVQHDLGALYAAEAALYNRASATYHQFLTPAQFHAEYGAPAAQLAAIRSFATAHGLSLVSPNTLDDYVLLSGTTAQVEATFDVSEHMYRAADGSTFFANTAAPTVPGNLNIDSVSGLESLDKFSIDSAKATGTGADQTCAPDPAVSTTGQICTSAYGPQDLWSIYDQPSDNFGEGQTVGILGAGQTADVIAALREFERTRNLPQIPVQVYRTDPADAGVPEANLYDGGRTEWELDTQAATGMAPHLAQVRLYFSSSMTIQSIQTALTTWADDPAGPLQANASFGIAENSPAMSTYGNEWLAATAQAAIEGRTLFASTGDTGAGCEVGAGQNGVTYGAPIDCYPAVDPNVVAVGGTVLYDDGSTTAPQRVSERAWDHTGGGPSRFVEQPPYQNGASPLLASNACISDPTGNPYPTGTLCRGIADVAALSGDVTVNLAGTGGPVNGYDTVDASCGTTGSSCTYTDLPNGGTSLSSPLWVGMWARVQAHHDAGNAAANSLGFANPLIYSLAENSATYARDFTDITVGSNGTWTASPGWDFPTGWGAPNVTNLVEDASANATTAPISSEEPQMPDPAPVGPGTIPPVPWVDGGWQVTTSANVDTTNEQDLFGVSCPNSTFCMAVGEAPQFASPDDPAGLGVANPSGGVETLAEQWSGASWSVVPTPNEPVPNENDNLLSVSCLSTTFCVAVGYNTAPPTNQTLVEQWDGSTWTIVPSPDPGPNQVLASVSCASATFCFAVGQTGPEYADARNGGGGSDAAPLVERWDGANWTVVNSPSFGSSATVGGGLTGVSCTSADFCAAVGDISIENAPEVLVTEQWNGATWSIVPSPQDNGNGSLVGISCTSPVFCMADGSSVPSAGAGVPYAERWDGTMWMATPIQGGYGFSYLTGVACAAQDYCVAVGTGQGQFVEGMIVRWDGAQWQFVSVPQASTSENYLFGASCSSRSFCATVGDQQQYDANGNATLLTLAEATLGVPSPTLPELPLAVLLLPVGASAAAVVVRRRRRRVTRLGTDGCRKEC